MELYSNYRGYGIRYRQIGGTTTVESIGTTIRTFVGFGEIRGREKAEDYINLKLMFGRE